MGYPGLPQNREIFSTRNADFQGCLHGDLAAWHTSRYPPALGPGMAGDIWGLDATCVSGVFVFLSENGGVEPVTGASG